MVPVGRLELPLSESKTDVLPVRRNGMCGKLSVKHDSAISESRLCFLKRVSELASVNVDGGAGSALVPAERIELTSSASEADVLPLDEAEM